MKWFKHMTNMSDDDFVRELIEEFEVNGYAWWCLLLEAYFGKLEEEMDDNITFNLTYLCQKMFIKKSNLMKFFANSGVAARTYPTFHKKSVTIRIPKALELLGKDSKFRRKKFAQLSLDEITLDERRGKEEKEEEFVSKKEKEESSNLGKDNEFLKSENVKLNLIKPDSLETKFLTCDWEHSMDNPVNMAIARKNLDNGPKVPVEIFDLSLFTNYLKGN
jgi:hypothetical protein